MTKTTKKDIPVKTPSYTDLAFKVTNLESKLFRRDEQIRQLEGTVDHALALFDAVAKVASGNVLTREQLDKFPLQEQEVLSALISKCQTQSPDTSPVIPSKDLPNQNQEHAMHSITSEASPAGI